MEYYGNNDFRNYSLAHFGIKGQKWGRRNYQNADGSYTPAGRIRYGIGQGKRAVGRAYTSTVKGVKRAGRSAKRTAKKLTNKKYWKGEVNDPITKKKVSRGKLALRTAAVGAAATAAGIYAYKNRENIGRRAQALSNQAATTFNRTRMKASRVYDNLADKGADVVRSGSKGFKTSRTRFQNGLSSVRTRVSGAGSRARSNYDALAERGRAAVNDLSYRAGKTGRNVKGRASSQFNRLVDKGSQVVSRAKDNNSVTRQKIKNNASEAARIMKDIPGTVRGEVSRQKFNITNSNRYQDAVRSARRIRSQASDQYDALANKGAETIEQLRRRRRR